MAGENLCTSSMNNDQIPLLLVGLDIGGTNLKAALYEVVTDVGGCGDDTAAPSTYQCKQMGGKVSRPTCAVLGPRPCRSNDEYMQRSEEQQEEAEEGARQPEGQGQSGPDKVVRALLELVSSLLERHARSWAQVTVVGMCCPGQVNRSTGTVTGAANLPRDSAWADAPLGPLMEAACGRPVHLINDADAAAVGEMMFGYGRTRRMESLAVYTLGTGVGMGLCLRGRLWQGDHGRVEGGHVIVDWSPQARPCPCGQGGCLEMYASATAVVQTYNTLASASAAAAASASSSVSVSGSASSMGDSAAPPAPPAPPPPAPPPPALRAQECVVPSRVRADAPPQAVGGAITAAAVALPEELKNGSSEALVTSACQVFRKAAVGGDDDDAGTAIAKRAVEECVTALAYAILNTCRTLDVSAVLLGGGVANAGGQLLDKVREKVQYSLIDQRPGQKMAQVCDERGVKLLCYGVLLGGFLSDKWVGLPDPASSGSMETVSQKKYYNVMRYWGSWEKFQELLSVCKEVASKHGVSIAQVGTRWVLQQKAVGGAIIGQRLGYTEHVADTKRVFDFQLDRQDLESLAEASRGRDLMRIIGDCGDEYRA